MASITNRPQRSLVAIWQKLNLQCVLWSILRLSNMLGIAWITSLIWCLANVLLFIGKFDGPVFFCHGLFRLRFSGVQLLGFKNWNFLNIFKRLFGFCSSYGISVNLWKLPKLLGRPWVFGILLSFWNVSVILVFNRGQKLKSIKIQDFRAES